MSHCTINLCKRVFSMFSIYLFMTQLGFSTYTFDLDIGQSGVRALPFGGAAERSVHCFSHYTI
jgi:hypothetical protein